MTDSTFTPTFFVDDFAVSTERMGIRLTDDARRVLTVLETLAESQNRWIDQSFILAVFIREIAPLNMTMLKHGLEPMDAAQIAERDALGFNNDKYHDIDSDRYGTGNGFGSRSALGSQAILRVRSVHGKTISPLDLVASLLDIHDNEFPPIENGSWTDEGLHVPFNTLSHIVGRKLENLWLPFDSVRKELNLLTPEAMRREPIEAAPSHVKNGLLSFFAEHPNYNKNCFLIMPFRESAPLSGIHKSIREFLGSFGINVLRADDFVYSEHVFTNIEVFMYGCKFAVSVVERTGSDHHNTNVALEIGYMLGLKKDVCLLKERTVTALPSDLQGRLYVEFDMFSIDATIRTNLGRWLRDRRIVNAERDG